MDKIRPLELYRKLSEEFGEDAARVKLIEEISELIKELSELQMLMIHNRAESKSRVADLVCSVLAEMADVMVTSERYLNNQNALEYTSMVYDVKIERTWNRLQNGELN